MTSIPSLSEDLQLSKLMLGTAQFGLPYGIANRRGQPSFEDVCAILEAAASGGVNGLDTAPVYGTSEEVLGRALRETGLHSHFRVISKIGHLADEVSSLAAACDYVEESITASLQRLGLDYLPVVLFHREQNVRYTEALLAARDKGLVRHVGTSIVTPEGALRALAVPQMEALQIPVNLFDHRFTRRFPVVEQSARQGVALFVRSVYLQGFLLMPETDVPPDLEEFLPVRRQVEALAQQAGMRMEELALRYALSLPGVVSLVMGVDSVDHIRHNLRLLQGGPLPPDLMAAIPRTVPELPDKMLLPNLWDRRMADVAPEKR